MLDLAIIGAGPAGLAAAIKGASEGLNVAVFESQARVGGRPTSSPLIENIPGIPRIDGPTLAATLERQASRFGAMIHTMVEVVELESTADGSLWLGLSRGIGGMAVGSVEARAVLLTVGLSERQVPGPCKQACDPDDLRRHGGQSVVFVGGGNSSVMLALACAEAGAHVTIVARRPLVENVSAYLLPRVEAANISVRYGEVTSVIRSYALGRDEVKSVTVHPGPHGHPHVTWAYPIYADHVYGFPGGEAKCGWIEVAKADDGRILTGSDVEVFDTPDRFPFSHETSAPGIFAAGDVRFGNAGSIAVAMGEGTRAVQAIMREYLPLESLPGKVRPEARN